MTNEVQSKVHSQPGKVHSQGAQPGAVSELKRARCTASEPQGAQPVGPRCTATGPKVHSLGQNGEKRGTCKFGVNCIGVSELGGKWDSVTVSQRFHVTQGLVFHYMYLKGAGLPC